MIVTLKTQLALMCRLVSYVEPHLVLPKCARFSKMDGSRSAHSSIVATIAAGVNDPSAGSPTEALLRLVLPLSDKVY